MLVRAIHQHLVTLTKNARHPHLLHIPNHRLVEHQFHVQRGQDLVRAVPVRHDLRDLALDGAEIGAAGALGQDGEQCVRRGGRDDAGDFVDDRDGEEGGWRDEDFRRWGVGHGRVLVVSVVVPFVIVVLVGVVLDDFCASFCRAVCACGGGHDADEFGAGLEELEGAAEIACRDVEGAFDDPGFVVDVFLGEDVGYPLHGVGAVEGLEAEFGGS